jgi:myo-inositol-1(or 4)-monophosphatase
MKELNKVKKVALAAAQEAGAELLKRFHKFSRREIMLKSHHEILTKADLAAEKIIISQVKAAFPDHHILSEESGENSQQSDWFWVIDPLDGTTNFSMHNPLWAVSIGVAYRGELVFGVVYAPYMKELFSAEKGKGTKLNNKKIAVSGVYEGKVLNTFCHSHHAKDIARAVAYYSRQKQDGFDCRQLGSASVELAYVAAGRIESIVIPGAHPWDVAAGVMLVQEAGGQVTDFGGKAWTLESPDMAASNGLVHGQIKGVLKNI